MEISRNSQTKPKKRVPTRMRLPTFLPAKPKSAPNVIMFTTTSDCREHDEIRRRLGFRRQEGGEAHAGWDSLLWFCLRVPADLHGSQGMLCSEALTSAAVPEMWCVSLAS